jgi:putative ABC transport system permease protein
MKRFLTGMFRNMKRNLLFSVINLSGLILGFVCIIIIALWIKNELSYDSFHRNSKNIYHVHRYFYDPNGAENLHLPDVAPIIAPLMEKEFSEIAHIARTYFTDIVFTTNNQKIQEKNLCFADPEILKIFTFEGLPADTSLLTRPLTVILSDEAANRYFPSDNAIGRTLEFKDQAGEPHYLEIVGVFRKWKQNSHFKPDFLVSFITLEAFAGPDEMKDWGSNNYGTFALIPHLPADMDKKLDSFINKNLDDGTKWTKVRLERLTDIHFNWYSSRSYIYILISIAFLILILGSINYMNLNAAMYSKRLKDINIRKIIGASRKRLVFQVMAESVLFCFIALLIAEYIASMALPQFNRLFSNPLNFSIRDNLELILGFIVLSIITGIVSGIYPLFIISSSSSRASRNKRNIIFGKASFRNGLVVFQFVVSIALIISFMLVSKQLSYLHHKELGLNKNNIIIIPATPRLVEKLDVFRQQLLLNPDIVAVSGSKRVPSDGLWDNSGARIISGGSSTPLGFRLANVRIDQHFIPTYGIKLLAGRNFHEEVTADSGYILNETAVKKIGWKSSEEAIGQIIDYGDRKAEVIGVVKDFHYESLHNPISPMIMYYDPSSFNLISIRIVPHNVPETLSFIEKTWEGYNNIDLVFSYEYLTDRYKNLYKAEENIRTIFIYCMILAISIAILGLVGMSVFLTERRTKEIGIRKVNGAKAIEVMFLLNKDFLKWVVIAFMIACPVAWYSMHKWLENFAYKTTLSWWVFAAAGAAALLLAFLTVSVQSYKAATRNPVESLKYE